MSKELEAIKATIRIKGGISGYELAYIENIEKALKALEIIKEKGLDIREFRYAISLYEYNICKNIGCKELTQEEYDLLKGVLL